MYLFVYLQWTNLQLKTDIILYTNKNSYDLIIKNILIHVNYLINFKIENNKNKKTTGLRNIIIQAI